MASPTDDIANAWKVDRRGENLRLSREMRAALVASVELPRVRRCRARTVQALVTRGICSDDGALTQFGWVTAVSLLPLAQQCRVSRLPFEQIECAFSGRPEHCAVSLFRRKPQWAFVDEGRTLHALIHALVLPRLYTVAASAWNTEAGYDRARSYFYGHYAAYIQLLEFAPDLVGRMLDDIRDADRDAFLASWRTLAEWNRQISTHPATHVAPKDAFTVLGGVGAATLAAIAAQVFSEPYAYFCGWPDIMLLDAQGVLRFIEVKTSDKLSIAQIITMCDMRAAAKLDMRVVKLKRGVSRHRDVSCGFQHLDA